MVSGAHCLDSEDRKRQELVLFGHGEAHFDDVASQWLLQQGNLVRFAYAGFHSAAATRGRGDYAGPQAYEGYAVGKGR